MTTLRDITPGIEAAINDRLGDEITYTPEGGAPLTFNGWVEFDNEEIRAPGSASTARVRVIEVPKTIVPTVSKEGDRIAITVIPGIVFMPAAINDGATGETHRITLKKAPNA